MKIIFFKFLGILILVVFLVGLPCRVSAGKVRMHPVNKVLMKLYPRSFELLFPEVPRVTGSQALSYYRSNKALFVHIGVDCPTIPGALHFSELQASKIKVSQLLKIAKGRMIIVY